MDRAIIIGSRGSDLALWQANYVKNELDKLGQQSEIKIIQTQGDRVQDLSFDKLEGKGFFTKEIEQQLLSKEIDLAVHSHKDLETSQPKGLTVASVPGREDPSELILISKDNYDPKMKFGVKANAIIGTSSARRKNQLRAFRPDLKLKDLRGNVPTRINKLVQNQYDAIMLAKAGVSRLNIDLSKFQVTELVPTEFIPAPAQGALALQIREDDQKLAAVLTHLTDQETMATVQIERKVLNLLDGGCQLPLGVYVERDGEDFKLWASLAENWEDMPVRIHRSGNADSIVLTVVEALKKKVLPTRVYVSKNLPEEHVVQRYCKSRGSTISARSQIEIEFISTEFPLTDWVFFSSANCVRAYFRNMGVNHSTRYAAMGGATAEVLNEFGTCDFVGNGPPNEVGEQFKKIVGIDTVCFPCSNKSLRTVENILPKNQVSSVTAYLTHEAAVAVEESDYYLFTSPSNVSAFLQINELPEGATVIAIGPSTKARLTQLGIPARQSSLTTIFSMIEETSI
jgi:hydroxymethylbilane synthase